MKMRRLAILAATLLLVGWMPHGGTAPNRWALIIGISEYMNFGPESGGDLPGASWDARRMRDVLVARWGFDASRVKLLLDTAATRARIVRELTEWLPSVVQPGDKVVFYFAGHGSQVWDLDGDEDDGLDETICPTDVLKGDPSRDILDDELNLWLSRLTAEVVVFLDNCHAGTGTRAVTPFARPRSLDRVATELPRPAVLPSGRTAEAPFARNVLEIAAAQADEVAVDAEWPGVAGAPATYGGAFTTTLVRHLWRAPRRTTYEDLFHLTAEDMKRQRFAQQPLLTKNGLESRGFGALGTDPPEPDEPSIPVMRVAGDGIELGGGAGAGMTAGSIYRAGDALLRITTVSPAAATAVVAAGTAPARGTSARLVAAVFPDAVLRVSLADVDDASGAAVRRAAGATQRLHFTSDAREFAHLIVRPAERGYAILGMDGATRHLLAGADRAASLRRVAEELQKEAGAHQLAALDNPGQAEPLEFAFRDGRTSFRLGVSIGFRVRAPRDGYLTIVDLGTDGRIVVLYPSEPGQDNRMSAGAVLELPSGDSWFEAQPPTGRGIVRAFLTDRPMALQFSDSGPEQAATVLAALLRAAGPPPLAGSPAVPVGSWLTSAIVYTIEN